MRNPDRVFTDVMSYADSVIPRPESFDSQSELVSYLERVDKKSAEINGRGRRLSQFALNEIADSTAATNTIKQGSRSQAVIKELSRTNRSRLRDESKTAKSPNLLGINKANLSRWKRNPERFDLRGVDTKTHSFIKQHIKDRSQKWKDQGLRVINDRDVHVFVVRKDKRDRLYAMNIINGHRVSKKVVSRHGTLKSIREKT